MSVSKRKGAFSVYPKAKKVKNPIVLSGALIKELRFAGAVVTKVKDERLFLVRMEYGDAAYQVYMS